MLNATQVLTRLTQQGWIEPAWLVSADVEITGVDRRNHNYHITGLPGTNLFVKQGRYRANVGSIAHEAASYQALTASEAAPGLRRFLPGYVAFDESTQLLVLESIPHAEDLQQYHTRRKRFPRAFARDVGMALAALHDARPPSQLPLQTVLPTVFRLHHPPLELLRGASHVGIQIVKLLQQHTRIGIEFEQLMQTWRTETLIHGDLKLGNIVAFRRRAAGRFDGIKVIDWEFAGLGDPRWDVGSIFSSYLALWMMSIPLAGDERPDQLIHLAEIPLGRIQVALREFWHSYTQARGLHGGEADTWLDDAVRFAAACIIQTAYELSKTTNFLSAHLVCLTQLSLNMFQQPRRAAIDLLGLAPQAVKE